MGVSNAMYTAVTGLDSFGTALGVVSDNIANANSTGWKSNSALFGDLVAGIMANQSGQQVSEGTGTSILGIATDFTTGATQKTGTWSNVMIQGKGFFKVNSTAAGGTSYYTRDGAFTIKQDASATPPTGYLVNEEGYYVQGVSGNIAVQTWDAVTGAPTYSSWEIKSNGEIWATPAAGGAKVSRGTLLLSTFPNEQGLIRKGSNLLVSSTDAGNAAVNTATTTNPEAGTVISGAIEGSNVDLAKEMVNMIIYQSDYTANSKAITTANNMLDTVVNLVR